MMERINIVKVKKSIVLLLLLTIATASQAQIFIDDEEFEGRMRLGAQSSSLIVPVQGQGTDQYTPIGEGVIALSVLGGAYLLAKRKKKH